jgi:hypothetical protein
MYLWLELLCNLWWWPLNLLRSWLVCKLVWNPSWFHGLPGYTGLSLLNHLLGGWFSYLISYNWSVLLHISCVGAQQQARVGTCSRSEGACGCVQQELVGAYGCMQQAYVGACVEQGVGSSSMRRRDSTKVVQHIHRLVSSEDFKNFELNKK